MTILASILSTTTIQQQQQVPTSTKSYNYLSIIHRHSSATTIVVVARMMIMTMMIIPTTTRASFVVRTTSDAWMITTTRQRSSSRISSFNERTKTSSTMNNNIMLSIASPRNYSNSLHPTSTILDSPSRMAPPSIGPIIRRRYHEISFVQSNLGSMRRRRITQTQQQHGCYPYYSVPSSPTRLFATSTDNDDKSKSSSAAVGSTTIKIQQQQVVEIMELQAMKREYEENVLELFNKNIQSTESVETIQRIINDLERTQLEPGFWDDSSLSLKVTSQLSNYKRQLNRLQKWYNLVGDIQVAFEMLLNGDNDTEDDMEFRTMVYEECKTNIEVLKNDNEQYSLQLLLSGPYDHCNVIVTITAGAGGTEANDWAADLKRMYERHVTYLSSIEYMVDDTAANTNNWKCTVLDTQPGDVVGYKTVELYIQGPNAFGWFQSEKGTHRLVRLSPFNANNKRQTTFCGVDLTPADFQDDDETIQTMIIPDNEIEITTMKSGGKGGQNVNKVNSAVRIKHIPTGIQVRCTQERSQLQNREIALQRLKAQLIVIANEQKVAQIQQIKGDVVQASWGTQIRNYVLHPYKSIKDQRSGYETSNAEQFLNGEELLKDCISSYLRYKASLNDNNKDD